MIPVCSWRTMRGKDATCSSPKISGGERPFDPAVYCTQCPFPNHPAVTPKKPAKPPCTHLGGEVRRLVCETCPSKPQIKVYACAIHGECTIGRRYTGVKGCCNDLCQDYTAAKAPWEWITPEQLIADTLNLLAPKLPNDVAGVVGIPTSGMGPAWALSRRLHLPLWSLSLSGELHQMGHGGRGVTLGYPHAKGRLIIIDDTAHSGAAIKRARRLLSNLFKDAIFAVVYTHPKAASRMDVYGRILPDPHLLEWNFFNHGLLKGDCTIPGIAKTGGVASDFDGVLCYDNAKTQADAIPLHLPRTVPVPMIITGRAESTRSESEAWLKRWSVRWQKLIMRPDVVPFTTEAIADWKGDTLKDSACAVYVESCAIQSEIIHKVSGKPVICPAARKVFTSP